jgi:hypothetical protein
VAGGLLFAFHGVTYAASPATIPATLPSHARLAFEAGAENFRWREIDDNGQRLLTEQGPRFVYGATLGNFLHADTGIIFEMHLGGYLGEVDYDGQDQSSSPDPADSGHYVGTVADYSGWYGEVNGGYRFADFIKGVSIDLFGGLGLDNWRREINGGVNSIGQSVSGSTEDYGVDYLRYGIGISLRDASPGGYLQLGFRRPYSISEKAQINGGTIVLSPGETASAFLSYRISLGRAATSYVKFYYSGYRLKKSPTVNIGSSFVLQPRSEMDTVGVTLGYIY